MQLCGIPSFFRGVDGGEAKGIQQNFLERDRKVSGIGGEKGSLEW